MIISKRLVLLIGILFGIFLTTRPVSAAGPTGSTYTPEVQGLMVIVIFFSILIASIVFGLLIFILIRFRESSNVTRKKIKNEMRIEIAWILFASIIVATLFLASLPVTQSYLTEQEDYDEEILIIAYKYNFTFVREDGNRTIDVVYLKVDTTYKFNITSIDVIHSFYAHELSIKLDMIPGRYNIIYLNIPNPGIYEVHCAEYCGFGHYMMQAKIIVT
jgi:heme/copper-type cytochrome/quinol oxidase subunit 2